MNPTVKVTSKNMAVDFRKDLAILAKTQVYVGIPESTAVRPKGAGINNPTLAFVHTHGVRRTDMRRIVRAKMNKGATYTEATAAYIFSHGSPLMAIPARPIIEPAIEAKGNKEAIETELKLAATAALEGKSAEMIRHLRLAGMTAQNVVRAWWTDSRNDWTPNAPSTIKAKGSSRPLINTGQLRTAISYFLDQGK